MFRAPDTFNQTEKGENTVTKNKRILVCLVIAFIFGFPFSWIQYKGEKMISIFQVFNLGKNNLFFDFSLLAINAFIIFIIWSGIIKFADIKLAKS